MAPAENNPCCAMDLELTETREPKPAGTRATNFNFNCDAQPTSTSTATATMAHQSELGTLHYAVYMPYAESASTALIRVEGGPYVEHLKEAICQHRSFKPRVGSEDVRLYACGMLSVSNDRKTRYEAAIEWLQGDRDAHEMEPAFLLTKYKNIIPTPAEAKLIDVIVATDSILEPLSVDDYRNDNGDDAHSDEDVLTPLRQASENQKTARRYAVSARRPSAALSDFFAEQIKHPIYNGRPFARVGLPVAIFIPAVAKLQDNLENIGTYQPRATTVALTAKLCRIISQQDFRKDSVFMEAVNPVLSEILGLENGELQQFYQTQDLTGRRFVESDGVVPSLYFSILRENVR
ncbi:hypothetical protein BDW22DRAFT_1348635 [Trametopsis cervina]|nr:hypothetical protein BDW22DRAFT_1348635 [Trametopsis cervina]